MFGWLRKLTGDRRRAGDTNGVLQNGDDERQPREFGRGIDADERPRRTVAEVFEAFYEHNRQPTPFGIHALCEAGAAELRDDREVLAVCERIVNHCNFDPISPMLRKNLADEELLAFLRWHEASDIDKEEYQDGTAELIRRFRAETAS